MLVSAFLGNSLNVDQSWRSGRTHIGLHQGFQNQSTVGCKATPDESSRTILRLIVQNDHGSTALEAVLMSSPRLATLCSSDVWQCEGHKLLDKEGHGTAEEERDIDMVLEAYSKYWNLSQPVFLDKKTKWLSLAKEEDKPLLEAKLPASLQMLGVDNLLTSYVIMYKPMCLWPMSHIIVQEVKADPQRRARAELKGLQDQMELHKYLVSVGRPVLVINYADLLWHPIVTKRRLEAFLPCLGSLDVDFVPKLGVDIFPGNNMKISTGVQSYGEMIDPSEYNYMLGDVENGTRGECLVDDTLPNKEVDFTGGLEQFLDSEEQKMLNDAYLYFDELADDI